jgi:hypothetical protein
MALIRAHAAALAWMRTATGVEIWETIAPSFSGADPESNRRAVDRYHRLGVWSFLRVKAIANCEKSDILRISSFHIAIARSARSSHKSGLRRKPGW